MTACRKLSLVISLMLVSASAWASATSAELASGSLEASLHDHWQGRFGAVELNDGSIFNEYESLTYSVNQQGAQLLVAFAPRFRCEPMVSIILPGGMVDELKPELELTWLLDKEELNIATLVDSEESGDRFSYGEGLSEHQALRSRLDRASWVTVRIPVTAKADEGAVDLDDENSALLAAQSLSGEANQDDMLPVHFSMLGSMLSVKATQEYCQNHQPIPYEQ